MDKVYCAIYTRKSTSEGLNGDFTSLDNQRESALNYIASQKSQGWSMIPQIYNDGGFTGANIERPALQKLLDDIKGGGINCVVVYKVDRLSRSLTDFARLLEFFDQHNVTFVSVTQHFNTQNSMGRLTLNILLSFAQFEREIISERTKDKMLAARKKGRWLGGNVPLGYDRDKENKALVVNKTEAALVREVFNLYLEKHALLEVVKILNARGLLTKRHSWKADRGMGGKPFEKKDVPYILNNYVYMGKIKYAELRALAAYPMVRPLQNAHDADLRIKEKYEISLLRLPSGAKQRLCGLPNKIGQRPINREDGLREAHLDHR